MTTYDVTVVLTSGKEISGSCDKKPDNSFTSDRFVRIGDWIVSSYEIQAFKINNAPEITLDDVRSVLVDKSTEGFTAEIQDILLKYNANKISELDKQNYECVYNEAQALGGAI